MANAEYMKYKDPKQPIGARIRDLMSRMTVEEKIGQMTQIERSVASEEVMNNYFIGNNICHYFDITNILFLLWNYFIYLLINS